MYRMSADLLIPALVGVRSAGRAVNDTPDVDGRSPANTVAISAGQLKVYGHFYKYFHHKTIL